MSATEQAIEAERERSQDDETRHVIALTEAHATPVLLAARWVVRFAGDDGLGCWDYPRKGLRLIHSIARERDGDIWAHVSVSRRDRVMPTWEQTRDVYRLVYPNVFGVIVIPPGDLHVNFAEVAHVWADLSRPAVPDFTRGLGTI